jgi:hypothetical protein
MVDCPCAPLAALAVFAAVALAVVALSSWWSGSPRAAAKSWRRS